MTRSRVENAHSGDVAWTPNRTSAGEIIPLACGHEVYRHLDGKSVEQRRAVLRAVEATFCPTCGQPARLWDDPMDVAIRESGAEVAAEVKAIRAAWIRSYLLQTGLRMREATAAWTKATEARPVDEAEVLRAKVAINDLAWELKHDTQEAAYSRDMSWDWKPGQPHHPAPYHVAHAPVEQPPVEAPRRYQTAPYEPAVAPHSSATRKGWAWVGVAAFVIAGVFWFAQCNSDHVSNVRWTPTTITFDYHAGKSCSALSFHYSLINGSGDEVGAANDNKSAVTQWADYHITTSLQPGDTIPAGTTRIDVTENCTP